MTKFREILRLKHLGCSEREIARSVPCSRNTVSKVLKRATELGLSWPLPEATTDAELEKQFYAKVPVQLDRRMPNFDLVHTELHRNGVSKKLLWTEYLEECRLCNENPLMYSQFCYYIQKDEEKRRATMHIARKPAEQVEVDWAGDTAKLTDPDTGEQIPVYIFVGVMSYSQYAYVEAFTDMKLASWIKAHVHMYNFFGGVARILVPDNCKTAVVHNNKWHEQEINAAYHELAEHYNTAILPARIRKPKDKPNAEGTVGYISTWIIAALRKEKFFTLAELNKVIQEKLYEFNHRPFQKKEGSRYSLFRDEELPFLAPLPATPYELSEWKKATVQYNYHISVDGMLYSIPFSYIGKKVDVRVTSSTIEVFFKQERIASHKRLYGRKGQYSTQPEHMPKDHQEYLEWNGDRFRRWAKQFGPHMEEVIDNLLKASKVEQQAYRGCMGILNLSKKYSRKQVEEACRKALIYTTSPSYKSIKNILLSAPKVPDQERETPTPAAPNGITRGAGYYGRERK